MSIEQMANNTEIKALTSLRGVAALAVVAQHFSATAQSHSSGWMPSIVPHGYMAVDFFFVLSGFIMSYTYVPLFQADGLRAFPQFFLKRVARIFPLGLAMLAIILLLGGVASIWDRSDMFVGREFTQAGLAGAVLVNVMHLQGFMPSYNLNAPSWSISLEMAAYLFFPVFIHIVWNGPRLMSLAFFLVGTSVLVGVAITHPPLDLAIQNVPFALVRCFTEFGYGVLVYRLFRTQGGLRRIGGDAWTWGITALSITTLILRLDLLAALSFPFVVLTWAWNTGSASRIMSARVPYFFGMISFSLYLVHHLFRAPELELLQYFWPEPVSPASALTFAFVGSISVIPPAALAYYYIEKPGRIAINLLVKRVRGPVGALASPPDPSVV